MRVSTTAYTVARYCDDMKAGDITVNRDYQRSEKVWPPAAKSYLIDTILLDYPVPKLSLYQRTDLKSRKTVNEIVDGQQRSQAILDFYEDKLTISGKSDFSGLKFSELDEKYQEQFIGYSLSVDVFTITTEDEVRQVFRRINSYNVPLNKQEQRHATFQGPFKWFMASLSESYASTLKSIGVFSEHQLSRMADIELLAEIAMAFEDGIQTSSPAKITSFYKRYDGEYATAEGTQARIDRAFDCLIDWADLHNTAIMKPYNVYSLLLAISHSLDPIPRLDPFYPVPHPIVFSRDLVLANLSALADALDPPQPESPFRDFVEACSGATNTVSRRATRFRTFCLALQPQLMQ